MIMNQRILCVSSACWEEPGELQVIAEVLSGANNIIWISPFGGISSNLLPRIDRLTESLTIYNPGINFLPLSFLEGFNSSRLLFHTKLYLLENDFEPDLIIFDSPELLKFTEAYKKTGAKALYYAPACKSSTMPRAEKKKVTAMTDFNYKAQSIPGEINEDEYMEMIITQVREISEIISKCS